MWSSGNRMRRKRRRRRRKRRNGALKREREVGRKEVKGREERR